MKVETRLISLVGHRIQTWALEEARRRLEAEGILPPPPTTAVAAAVVQRK